MTGKTSQHAPLLNLRDVSKWYGKFQVLNGINLEVNAGEKIVICGPSGSGKSTIIRCVNGLEGYQHGQIFVGNDLVRQDSAGIEKIRQRVGMVFQSFNLFPHMTVLQNLTLGPIKLRHKRKADAEAAAIDLLKRVHIAEHAHKYPNQLSGGQQQRVAIARAVAMEPDIMLFDEPTSALDPEMVKEVLDVMTELARTGMTMVCVTHEMGFARAVADRVVFVCQGRITEVASPDTFFTAPQTERARQFLQQIIH
ncbi:amino acid ABC transporter ATP-binding protein [Ochrobactrum sp. CM-21-5]|nr:amino acid ABC transporter ATP-binding protein [Ochrobactrum sp. CM-21-5]MBC2887444.1 amino acid ABC transporter ATP-binding protein [Ochrobactrum sp. CM-21-5]